jgi:UDP-N-acetylmuramoyl-L-alanyl-D-glutamate--2,6-diaminopimelate ligase
VLDADDSSFSFLAQIPAERRMIYTVQPQVDVSPAQPGGQTVVLRAANVRQEPSGMGIEAELFEAGKPAVPLHLVTRLVGRFNASNVLAAAGAAIALGVDERAIVEGVAALPGIVGRMERIDRGQSFTALVDFAHTPNALAAALATARDLVGPDRRVIAVFGSAGLRDREKRRLMGAVASQHADYTVITAEDPRTEDLAAILAETAGEMAQAGRVEGTDFVRIPDRQTAILHAVRNANTGDVVLVCGKGHEQSMCFGTVEHPWRDQDALAWALDRLSSEKPGEPPFILPTWSLAKSTQ